MYFGTYKKEDVDIRIPKNYNGTYFLEDTSDNKDGQDENTGARCEKTEDYHMKNSECDQKSTCTDGKWGFFEKLFGKDIKPCIPKFDAEDLLLLGLATFLFFSKNGDRECALILAMLIFIS